MRRIALFTVILLLTIPSQGGAATADVTDLYRLDNGLELRLFPRPFTPLVATLVLVRTGYASETTADSGYSHLLEHLLFAGTETRGKEQIKQEVEEMGAYFNGYTREDYTGYLMVGHREHLDRHLSILSDILFRSVIADVSVDEAKEVVIEEIRRRRSRPDTRWKEMFQSLLYRGSAYAGTGLGNEMTVSGAVREDILSYYRRTYTPDNMLVLMAGGVTAAETVAIAEKHFGAVPPGGTASVHDKPVALSGQRIYTFDGDLPERRFLIGFNGPGPADQEVPAMELLAALLGGDGGLLKEALGERGFEPRSVGADLTVHSGFSRFVVSASFPGRIDAEEALKALLEELDAIAETPIPEERLARDRVSLRSGEIMGREKIHYYLMDKAVWAAAGAPGEGISAERWEPFGPEDLSRAVKSYLAGQPYLALVTLPRSETANADSGQRTKERRHLGNGLTVIAEQRTGSGVFAVHLMTRRRAALEPPGKAGIADFVHRLLARGTVNRNAAAIEKEIRRLGLSFSAAGNPTVPFGDFYTSRGYSYVRMESLDERAGEALALLAEMTGKALFPPDEVEKVRSQMLDYIRFVEEKPDALASRLLAQTLFAGSRTGNHVLGSAESISALQRQDLLDFRDRYFTGNNLIIAVVSGMAPAAAAALVEERFSAFPAGVAMKHVSPVTTEAAALVERKLGKAQGALLAGSVTGPLAPEDRPALAVLAGLLNDRLQRQLREKEGLAYSLGASLSEVEGSSVFTFSMGTGAEKIDRAREGLRREIEALREAEFSSTELKRRINSLTGRLQMRMLSSINRAFYLSLADRKGLSHTYDDDYRLLLTNLTPDQVEAAARRYLPRHLVEIIVR